MLALSQSFTPSRSACEVEEDVLLQQQFLELVGLGRFDLLVGRNAAAAVHRAAGVSELHLGVGGVGGQRAGVVVVVVVE